MHGIFFIRLDATNEAVYELVAELIHEPQAGEPQAAEVAEQATKEVANPADLQGKPRSITLILIIQCLFKYLCIYVLRVVGNPSMHVLPRYPWVYTSMQMLIEMLC